MASPDVIGVNSGAAAAAVFAIVLFGATGTAISIAALTGSGVTVLAIYLLAWRRGVTGHRLVLVGIGVTAALGSVTRLAVSS